jgi:hypothetical protein
MEVAVPEIKTQNTRLMTCPWCGYENKDSWELDHDNENETDCGRCEKPIVYIADVSVTWSTFKGKEAE